MDRDEPITALALRAQLHGGDGAHARQALVDKLEPFARRAITQACVPPHRR